MTGRVNTNLEAAIQLQLRGPLGESRDVIAVIDTGFTGGLTLPKRMIEELRLQWLSMQAAELADGRIVPCAVYSGMVQWHDAGVPVEVDEAETAPLVGMELMKGSELRVEVRRGGTVAITKLTRADI